MSVGLALNRFLVPPKELLSLVGKVLGFGAFAQRLLRLLNLFDLFVWRSGHCNPSRG